MPLSGYRLPITGYRIPMPIKSFHRSDRVSAQLRRELGKLVHEFVREHGLPSHRFDLESPRLAMPRCSYCVDAVESRGGEGLKALSPQIRYQLGRR